MTEQEAAEKLCALLNEIEAAGHVASLYDCEVWVGSGLYVGTTYAPDSNEFVVRAQ